MIVVVNKVINMIEITFFDNIIVDKEIKEKLADMDENDLRHLIIHLVNKDNRIKKHILKY